MNLISNTIRKYSTQCITNPWTGKAIKNTRLSSSDSMTTINENYFPSKITLDTESQYTTCSLTGGKIRNNYLYENNFKHLMSISKDEILNNKTKRTLPLLLNSLSQITV